MPATFTRNAKGQFVKDSNIFSLAYGEGAYLLENELNEMQWNILDKGSLLMDNLISAGLISDTVIGVDSGDTFHMDTNDSAIYVAMHGYAMAIGHNSVVGQPVALASRDNRIIIKLNPSSTIRTDLVFLETWIQSVSYTDGITKFGGESTPPLPTQDYNMLDPRVNAETARRYVWRWRIRVIDGKTDLLNINALNYAGNDTGIKYVKHHTHWMVDLGEVKDGDLNHISDGGIHAIPLFTVARKPTTDITISDISAALSRTKLLKYFDKEESDARYIKGDSGGGGALISGNLTVEGDLKVIGNSMIINTTELNVADNLVRLNSDFVGANPTENAGVEIERGDLENVALRWNESNDTWEVTTDGISYYKIWHSGITGAGQGLDADSLKSYVPGNATGNLAINNSVLNIGLDSDKLDSQHGSYYTDPSNMVWTSNNRSVTDIQISTWDAKQNAITGAASSILFGNLTGDRAIMSDASGKIAVSIVSNLELSYLSGTTSSVQTQLNSKQPNIPEAPYITGVTSSIQAQLDSKLNLSGGTMVGRISSASTSGNIASNAGSSPALEVLSNGGVNDAAYVSFHRTGTFAGQFGLDSDNFWKVGGWSHGAVSYKLFHEGNHGPGTGLHADFLDGVHLSDVWANLSGTRTSDSIFSPAVSGGNVGIVFNSKVDGSDKGYVRFYDDHNGYAYWGDTPANNALIIGVENDGRDSNSDVVVLKSPASVIADTAEFRVTSVNGYATFGAQNAGFFHFTTDRGGFYFNKQLNVAGEIYAGPSYNQLVWNAGNDGAGSGLDSDLFEGQHGSFYTNPANMATNGSYRFVNDSEKNYWNGKQDALYLSASRAMATDVNGRPAATGVTVGELNTLSGIYSSVQNQLNTKLGNNMNNWTSGYIETAAYLRPSVGGGANGIIFPDNPYGGGGDTAYMKYFSRGGEAMRLEIGIGDNPDDDLLLYASGPLYLRNGANYVDTGNSLRIAGNIDAGGQIYSGPEQWFRVRGSSGIYWDNYGGGWNMSDYTWIRAYGDKSIYTGGEMQAGTVRATTMRTNVHFILPGYWGYDPGSEVGEMWLRTDL